MKRAIQIHQEWVDRQLAANQPMTEFNCPECDFAIATLKPVHSDDVYDTMSTCPSCSVLFFKVVYSDGTVEIS